MSQKMKALRPAVSRTRLALAGGLLLEVKQQDDGRVVLSFQGSWYLVSQFPGGDGRNTNVTLLPIRN